MITLAFYHGHGGTWRDRLLDSAIRAATRGSYSHVELVNHSGPVQAGKTYPCLSASPRDGGVRETHITLKPESWTLIAVHWEPKGVVVRVADEVGTKYDTVGVILTHVLALNVSGEGRWFCSEIIAYALGIPRPHRYSPTDLFYLVQHINLVYQSRTDQ